VEEGNSEKEDKFPVKNILIYIIFEPLRKVGFPK